MRGLIARAGPTVFSHAQRPRLGVRRGDLGTRHIVRRPSFFRYFVNLGTRTEGTHEWRFV